MPVGDPQVDEVWWRVDEGGERLACLIVERPCDGGINGGIVKILIVGGGAQWRAVKRFLDSWILDPYGRSFD